MARRRRSWISRSTSSEPGAGAEGTLAGRFPRRGRPRVARSGSAAITPRDPDAEEDVEPSESGGHQAVAPAHRTVESERAEQDEAEPHHRHDRDREEPARDDSGPVQGEPDAGDAVREAGEKGRGQEGAHGDREPEAQ